MSMVVRALLVSSFAVVPIVACGGGGGLAVDPGLDAGEGGAPEAGLLGKSVGEACDEGANRCRPGLACVNGTCAPGRSSESGTPCVISAECKDGLFCGPERKCTPAGTGGASASCSSDADCKSGLRCNIVGFGAQCQPEGSGDVGGTCKTSGDCFGGLGCAGGTCAPLPPGAPIAIPTWKGVECSDDPPPVVAYFRVPRGSNDGDFFRLPFPNDVRRDGNGHPTLFGFPTPGSEILGFDVVDRYVKDVEQSADGFSAYATITMRFSGEVDFDSLKAQGAVRLVDLTEGEGGDLGLSWIATTGRSAYVCNNSIGIRPRDGEPFVPGHTYAAFITSAAKTPGGGAIARTGDLSALLAPGAPADAVLAPAYAKYAPLRAWAAAKSFDLGTVLNAAVFTVAHTTRPAEKLAEAIGAAAPPTASGWVKCGAAPSPCPDVTGERACGAADPAFDELHALVTLPIFQKGTAPYLNPTDGGDLVYGAGGLPQVQRTEQVCMALTVPKGSAMPAGGWPLVVYAHGTGGSFRSHVTEGVAKSLAESSIAVLGIDQVQHGPRRNGSTQSPNDLFFNFGNPAAARGNPLQGAADQMSLVRFARAQDGAIKFDRISFWGHSQGATEGAIAMPYTPDVAGVVLSGIGASLIDALLTKTSPVNIKAAVPFVLVEPSGVNEAHPALSLLQNAIDPADPLSHGRTLDKHVFVPFGQKDTYTPSAVQATYVLAAGLGLASPPASVTQPEAIGNLQPIAVPASGNLASGARTGVAREYAPAGYDGHFVVFRDPDGKKDAARFLADLAAGTVPNVGGN